MIALIDADIVTYSCAIYNEPFGWQACKDDIDALIKRILETVGADEYLAFISGSNNFRYTIYPEYKANRKNKADPIFRQEANAYLVTEYHAIVTDGYEADDAIGISATELGDKCIICSIDKDLKQIAGRHYNWRKNEFDLVDPVDGLRSFYRSLLTGDSTDNIPPVGGYGAVKSAKVINDLVDEWDMYEVCSMIYGADRQELMHQMAKCLWILREEDKMWEAPAEIKRDYQVD